MANYIDPRYYDYEADKWRYVLMLKYTDKGLVDDGSVYSPSEKETLGRVVDHLEKTTDYTPSEYENRNNLEYAGKAVPGKMYKVKDGKLLDLPVDSAVKNDAGKLRYDLIPPEAMEALAEVYTIGARKYADRNWEKGMAWSRIFRALVSHSWKWFRGEKYDPVDGQLHMASVMWCAAALIAYDARKIGTDDRVKVPSIIKEVQK